MQNYKEKFYTFIEGSSERSAREIVPLIIEWIQPRRLVDVGCGTGTWLSVFKEYGVKEVLGVDGNWVPQSSLQISESEVLYFDLSQPLQLDGKFDLVISLEVAEHLPESHAATFVKSLTQLGPVILFSAAIPYQGGVGHINEQWPEYWVEIFSSRGYVAIDCLRSKFWQNNNVAWWFSQNMLLFVNKDCLDNYPLLKSEHKSGSAHLFSIIHPKNYVNKAKSYKDAINPETMSLKRVLKALPTIMMSTVRRRMKLL